MNTTSWKVEQFHVNPETNLCIGCGAPLGEEHATECVVRAKTVVVEFTFTVPILAPESFTDQKDLDRFLEQFCANNILEHLLRLTGYRNGCLCHYMKAKYLRDATPHDEEEYNYSIEDVRDGKV